MTNIQDKYAHLKKYGISRLQQAYLKNMYWYKENKIFKDGQGYFNGTIEGIDTIGRLKVTNRDRKLTSKYDIK